MSAGQRIDPHFMDTLENDSDFEVTQLHLLTFRERFLREAPRDITKQRAYFTIVGAHPTREQAEIQVANIRNTYQELDTSIYPPSNGRTSFNVMIASYTSMSEAQEALRISQSRGLEGYIWAIP